MKILAIESSCDETAAAVVEDGRNIISSVVASQVEEHKLYGGVSANSLLRRTLAEECKKRDWEMYMPEKSLCGDNAAMVGSQGYYEFLSGNIAGTDLNAFATMSIEKG